MPNYPFADGSSTVVTSPVTALWPGDRGPLAFVAFANEQPAVPQASVEMAMAIAPSEGGQPSSISVEVQFSGAPGVFELDVQEADTDADIFYRNVSGGVITAVDATDQTARADLQIRCGFVRLNLESRANAVNLTAKISR